MFALLGSWSCSFDKYILWYGQIHFAISTNTFCNFDKYILQKHDIHIRFARVLEAGQYGFNIIEISKLIRTEERAMNIEQWSKKHAGNEKTQSHKSNTKKVDQKLPGCLCAAFFIIVCYCYCLFVCYCCMLLLPCCLCAAFSGEPCQRRRCGRTDANPS